MQTPADEAINSRTGSRKSGLVSLAVLARNTTLAGKSTRTVAMVSLCGVNVSVVFLYKENFGDGREFISTAVACFESVGEGGRLLKSRNHVMKQWVAGMRPSRDMNSLDCPSYFALRANDGQMSVVTAWYERQKLGHAVPEKRVDATLARRISSRLSVDTDMLDEALPVQTKTVAGGAVEKAIKSWISILYD